MEVKEAKKLIDCSHIPTGSKKSLPKVATKPIYFYNNAKYAKKSLPKVATKLIYC
jgi:hypothetical protein